MVVDSLDLAAQVVPTLKDQAAAVDAAACFPEAGVKALRDNGLFGLLVPVEHGGLGRDLANFVAVAQTLASGCMSTAMIWAMHCQQVDAVVRHGTPQLRAELLPRIAAGEVYLASVTTEPGKGGHLLTAEASLQESDGLVEFQRDAPIVTGGQYADGFLITMRESPEAPENRVTLVYAAADQLVRQTQGTWDPLGMRGTHSVQMRLVGAVKPHQIIGDPGKFRDVATDSMIPVGHLAWASCWLGAARAGLSDVVRLIGSRSRPRSLDPASSLLQARLARVRINLELVSGYLHRVCDEVTRHRRDGRSLDTPATQVHLNTLKVAAAELTFDAISRLIKVTGMATGYLKTSPIPLERHFRDLRSASLNYSDDRLLTAIGTLAILDRATRLA